MRNISRRFGVTAYPDYLVKACAADPGGYADHTFKLPNPNYFLP